MNPIVAGRVVAAMVNVWPSMTVAEQTVEAWSVTTPEISEDTALTAVRRLAKTEDFAPSIARFLAECRLIERERATPYLALGPGSHSTREQAIARVRAIKAFWSEASRGRPEHDHRFGDDGCSRCATRDQFIADNTRSLAKVLAEFPIGANQ